MSKGKCGTTAWQDSALSHLDALYGFAIALTRDPIEAEDLVQETYMQAVGNIQQFKAGSNIKAWLFTIMRNANLKRLRHLRSGPDMVTMEQDAVEQQVIDTDDPEALCIRIWEREEIRAALEQLPGHCREIIVSRDIEGFSYNELAEIFDCPVGTIMSRLARARAKLKCVLSNRRVPLPKTKRDIG